MEGNYQADWIHLVSVRLFLIKNTIKKIVAREKVGGVVKTYKPSKTKKL